MTAHLTITVAFVSILCLSFAIIFIIYMAKVVKQNTQRETKLTNENDGVEVGKDFSELTLTDINGIERKLTSDKNKKGTLLIFGSSSCAACHQVILDLPQFNKESPNINILFSLNMTEEDKTMDIDKMYDKHGIHKDTIIIPEFEGLAQKFQNVSYPFMYFLTNDGIIFKKGLVNSIRELRIMVKNVQ